MGLLKLKIDRKIQMKHPFKARTIETFPLKDHNYTTDHECTRNISPKVVNSEQWQLDNSRQMTPYSHQFCCSIANRNAIIHNTQLKTEKKEAKRMKQKWSKTRKWHQLNAKEMTRTIKIDARRAHKLLLFSVINGQHRFYELCECVQIVCGLWIGEGDRRCLYLFAYYFYLVGLSAFYSFDLQWSAMLLIVTITIIK